MAEEKQKKRNKMLVVKALAFALIIALVVWVIWLLSNQREEHVTAGLGQDDLSTLECVTSEIKAEDDFLSAAERTEGYEFKIKTMFNGDKLDKVSYEFNGTYSSAGRAETREAELRAKYYKYMEQNGLGTEYLNPILVDTENKLKISFYAERKRFTSVTAPIFMISRDEYANTGSYSLENFEKIYKSKGFSCSTYK